MRGYLIMAATGLSIGGITFCVSVIPPVFGPVILAITSSAAFLGSLAASGQTLIGAPPVLVGVSRLPLIARLFAVQVLGSTVRSAHPASARAACAARVTAAPCAYNETAAVSAQRAQLAALPAAEGQRT